MLVNVQKQSHELSASRFKTKELLQSNPYQMSRTTIGNKRDSLHSLGAGEERTQTLSTERIQRDNLRTPVLMPRVHTVPQKVKTQQTSHKDAQISTDTVYNQFNA